MFNRDDFYTTKEFQEKTGYPRDSVWRWCRESKVSSHQIGKTYIIPKTKENEAFAKKKMSIKNNT